MVDLNQVVREVVVRGVTQGVDQTIQSAQRLGDAVDRVAIATDRTSRATLSAESRLQALMRRYDEQYRRADALAKVERDLARAREQGLISIERSTELMGLATTRLSGMTRAVNDNARATGLAGHQLQNLFFQANDVVASLASGSSPMTVLMQQGGQVAQIFGPGVGVTGVLKGVWEGLSRLIPTSFAVGGGVALGAGIAIKALNDWDAANKRVALSLNGIGRGSGLTVSGLNDLARRTAGQASLSIPTSRDVATAIASTGRAGRGEIESAIKLSRDLSTTLRVDMEQAGEILADVFRDPLKSFDALNEKLGFGTAATRNYVRALQDQSRYAEAGQVVLDGVSGSLAKTAEMTTFTAQKVEQAKRIWQDFWYYVDRGAAVAFGPAGALGVADDKRSLSSLDRQIEGMKAAIAAQEEARKAMSARGTPQWLIDQIQPISDLKSALDDLAKKHEEVAARIARATAQETEAARASAAEQARLARDKAMTVVYSLGRQIELSRMNPIERSTREALDQAGLTKPPAGSRFESVFEEAAKPSVGSFGQYPSTYGEYEKRAADAFTVKPDQIEGRIKRQVVIQNDIVQTKALDEAMRQSRLSLEAEAGAIGKSAGAADELRFRQQALAQAGREGIPVTEAVRASIDKAAAAYGALSQKLAEARLENDLTFQRMQLGRTQIEQTVAATLRPVFGDDLSSARAQAAAQEVRNLERMKDTQQALNNIAQMGAPLIDNLVDGTRQWADVWLDVAKNMEKALLQAALFGQGPFASLLGLQGAGQGPGGLLGLLTKGAGGLFGGSGFAADDAALNALPDSAFTWGGGHARGGWIRGAGTATSDSILARLSNQEFVVNAHAASKHARLLEAINADRLPRFATGGPIMLRPPAVPATPAMPVMSAGRPEFHLHEAPGVKFDIEQSDGPQGPRTDIKAENQFVAMLSNPQVRKAVLKIMRNGM